VPRQEKRASVPVLHGFLHAAKEVRGAVGVDGLQRPGARSEDLRIKECKQQTEVLGVAFVRRGGHEKEVARPGGKVLGQLVAPGLLDLVPVSVGRKLVRLVENDEVPCSLFEARQNVGLNAEVDRSNHEIVLYPGVLAVCRSHRLAGEQYETLLEPLPHLAAPLIGESLGAEHEHAADILALHQLAHQQPSHDRLAGSRVVGKQEPYAGERQYPFVDGLDLVGQGIDLRDRDSELRVEDVREMRPEGLRGEPEESWAGIKCVYAGYKLTNVGLVLPNTEQPVGVLAAANADCLDTNRVTGYSCFDDAHRRGPVWPCNHRVLARWLKRVHGRRLHPWLGRLLCPTSSSLATTTGVVAQPILSTTASGSPSKRPWVRLVMSSAFDRCDADIAERIPSARTTQPRHNSAMVFRGAVEDVVPDLGSWPHA
jgi:hypothetical protein